MRILVDHDRCEVHGDCVVAAPEVFDIGDDDDSVRLLVDEPGEELRTKVELAVTNCPVSALRIG